MLRHLPLAACVIALFTFLPVCRAQDYSKFSDEAVQKAIEKGAGYLWSRLRNDNWGGHEGRKYPVGPTALAAYALMETGVSPQDPRMAKVLDWLSGQEIEKTYELGVICNTWLIADRKAPGKYRKLLERDVRRLYTDTRDGSYNYENPRQESRWDHSNDQYGVLGVWAGAQANMEIPFNYWQLVLGHWLRTQCQDGGWQYQKPGSTSRATMVAAGVATLYVCVDSLFVDRFVQCTGGGEFGPIRRGLAWFDKNFTKSLDEGKWFEYYLYGVERVGLASGYKYFGTADWYKLGCIKLIEKQKDGGWDGVVDTSFALLFLVRGRRAVLFNKLEYDGDWCNRPRDLASLTRWFTNTFDNIPVAWQIINLKVPVREWHDAPILYIAGSKAPKFSDGDLDKIREFVLQGGTILSVAECSGAEFMRGIREAYVKMFPRYELTPVGPQHEIYSLHFQLRGRPRLHELSNGVRPFAIHCDEDLPLPWQLRQTVTMRNAYEAAANIAMYVTDKAALLRARGTSHWPEDKPAKTTRTLKLARLEHSGNFDPEPLAYQRFSRLMAQMHETNVDVAGPMKIADLPSSGAKLASLTGTGRFLLDDQDKAALKRFVSEGGTLVIDAAGGSKAFAEAAEEQLTEMFGLGALRRLASTAPVYNVTGLEIERVRYRRQTRVRLGNLHEPNLKGITLNGRLAVLYSTEDITAGLVGNPSYTCDGYDPDSAFALMRNIVLRVAGK